MVTFQYSKRNDTRFMRLEEEEIGLVQQLLAFWTAIYLPPPPWVQPLHGALVCTAGSSR